MGINHNAPVFICSHFLKCDCEGCEHSVAHNRIILEGLDECRINHCIVFEDAKCVQMMKTENNHDN